MDLHYISGQVCNSLFFQVSQKRITVNEVTYLRNHINLGLWPFEDVQLNFTYGHNQLWATYNFENMIHKCSLTAIKIQFIQELHSLSL
jgi:hypothetical protein